MDDWKSWEGRTIDQRFRLAQFLGNGPHSGVFATEFQGQPAALKLIRGGTSDWAVPEGLDHPHLLRILDAGKLEIGGEDMMCLVMEFADDDLSKVLPERALTEQEASDILPPVVSVLDFLHRQGLVHGGLKPSNVLALGDQLKLSSDRIARAGQSSQLPRTPYDAPEVAATGYTPASDMWALGVTLVEILTRRATSQPDLRKLPPRFAAVVRRCLQTDPPKRPIASDIPALFAGTLPAEPVVEDDRPRAVAASRRNVALIGGLALLGAAVIVGPKLIDRSPQPAQVAAPIEQAVVPAPAAQAADSSGEVVAQILPAVEARAQRSIRGRVQSIVRVDVDASGRVREADLQRSGSRYFGKLALEAARQWTFKPPVVSGQAMPSRWDLTFEFTRSDVKARTRALKP